MSIRKIFASNLRKTRQARGLSQEDLAFKAGIHRTYVSSLERCQYSASIDTIETIAHILEVEVADLLRAPAKQHKAEADDVGSKS
ncbi:transcriptional regulator [Xaviernesmea oryzae]|uniref:Transcriptional regulator n=1 Tax=Xaviernesmea oryzae TaxID=464029 RepID=A0A1Q9AVY6_9HYPH|nr:helix-turn-helix transcriptional regulator [Xaviernesmea oryzae]OLP59631.1 transcriptional regulator [Xaviernesmea oryzae]